NPRPGSASVRSVLEDPGILAAAALGRIHDERAFPERDAGQAARDDRYFFTVENERPQVDVPSLHAVVAKRWGTGERDDRLGDVVARLLAHLVLELHALGLGGLRTDEHPVTATL